MKLKLFFGFFLLNCGFLGGTLFAQNDTPFCIIKNHPYDIEKAREEINALCKIGYAPMGMEVVEGVAIILVYIKTDKPLFTNWALIQFTDLSKIEAEYAAMLKQGWVPIAFSYTKTGHYVLFLKNQLQMTGFRIVNVNEDLAEIEKTIQAFAAKNFLPYGLSYYNQKIWIFFLGVKEQTMHNLRVCRYKDVELAFNQGVKEQIEQGFIPISFAFSNDWVYFIFSN